MMKPNIDAAVDFLLRFEPEGPWLPTAIWPDKPKTGPKISARTFHKGEEKQLREWIETRNARGQGIYFHVNRRLHDLAKKAEKVDIAEAKWLHVDVDPEPRQDLDAERERILGLFGDRLPEGLPKPTLVLFSGGGYQAFWELGSPVPIQGQESAWTEFERYTKQLENVFGGDNCWNVDRVMRLPGTVNWPNEKKRKNGQQPELAEVISWDPEAVYQLAQFTKAPLKADAGSTGLAGARAAALEISGNVPTLSADLSELDPYGVSDWLKVVIVNGLDPDEPHKHSSPSEWQWAVSCALARQEVPDELHYAVLMDRDLGISETIFKKGSGADRYARRQIARAKELAEDENLLYMNDRYAVVKQWDGTSWVIHEQWDEIEGRDMLVRIPKTALFDGYANQFVEETSFARNGNEAGVRQIPLGKWWFTHPKRRTYDTVKFAPGMQLSPEIYNLWRGFAVDAIPGDCSLFLAHVRDNVCAGNEEHYEWLLNWLARMVQSPAEPGSTAIVMRGPQGIGKGVFVNAIGHLFGRHYMPVSDPKRITGNFNAHLRDCVLLFADEAFHTADRNASNGALKALITEEFTSYEVKGKEASRGRNFVHIIMASNEDWVVPADVDDRRFFVLDVGAERKEDFDYFRAIKAQLSDGGYEALLHLLLTRDIGKFNHREAPKTRGLMDQKIATFAPEVEWWFEKLMSGNPVPEKVWADRVYTSELAYDLKIRNGGRNTRSIQTKIGNMLRKFCPGTPEDYKGRAGGSVEVIDVDGMRKVMRQPSYYEFPSLANCRAHFNRVTGSDWDWPRVDDEAPSADTYNDGGGEF